MRLENCFIIAVVLACMAFAGSAWAQGDAAPQAPAEQKASIGHRQSTARIAGRAQSMQRIGTDPELRKEDEDLDRKLNTSICRGC